MGGECSVTTMPALFYQLYSQEPKVFDDDGVSHSMHGVSPNRSWVRTNQNVCIIELTMYLYMYIIQCIFHLKASSCGSFCIPLTHSLIILNNVSSSILQ